MKRVRAGVLRHPIIVQRLHESKDSLGQVVFAWSNLFKTFAYIKPLTGGEWFVSDHLRNSVDHQVVIRNTRTVRVTPKDRIIFDGRIFDILRVLDFEERLMHYNILTKENYDEVYTPQTAKNILTEDGLELLTESSENLVTEH